MAFSLDGNAAWTTPFTVVNLNTGSFVGWFRPDFVPSSTDPRYLFDTEGARHAFFTNDVANELRMFNDGRDVTFPSTGLWSAGDWTHFAFLYNKTGSIQRCFVNGLEITANTPSGSWGATGSSSGLHIAQRFNAVVPFTGDVADVAIYSAVLADASVVALSKGYSPALVEPSVLNAWWPLVRDNVPYFGNYVLTNVGSPVASAHPALIRPSAQILQFPPVAAVAADLIEPSLLRSFAVTRASNY